jgi:hypothetical protein
MEIEVLLVIASIIFAIWVFLAIRTAIIEGKKGKVLLQKFESRMKC